MKKSIIAISLFFFSMGAFSSYMRPKKGVKVPSKKSDSRLFNESLATMTSLFKKLSMRNEDLQMDLDRCLNDSLPKAPQRPEKTRTGVITYPGASGVAR